MDFCIEKVGKLQKNSSARSNVTHSEDIAPIGAPSEGRVKAKDAASTVAPNHEALQSRMNLLNLPAELRNQIYYHASLDALPHHVEFQRVPALLHIARQIREEFAEIYFGRDIMRFEQIVDYSTPQWREVRDATMLMTVFRHGTGSRRPRSWTVWHRELSAPSGDLQGAKASVTKRPYGPKDWVFEGVLVFPAASRQMSRRVLRSARSRD